MAMKFPVHPGRLVKADIEVLGVSIAKAASALGVTRQQLYRLVNCETAISAEMALRLEIAIGGDAMHWLNMQIAYDLAQIRNKETTRHVRKLESLVA